MGFWSELNKEIKENQRKRNFCKCCGNRIAHWYDEGYVKCPNCGKEYLVGGPFSE